MGTDFSSAFAFALLVGIRVLQPPLYSFSFFLCLISLACHAAGNLKMREASSVSILDASLPFFCAGIQAQSPPSEGWDSE